MELTTQCLRCLAMPSSGGGIRLVVGHLDTLHYPGLNLLRYFYPNLLHAVRGSARGPSLRVCSKVVCQL